MRVPHKMRNPTILGGDIYYSNQSQAELTLSRYGNGGSANHQQTTRQPSLPTKRGDDGNMYPYNPEDPEYLSHFPIGFKGCFKCGKADHWSRKFCPVGDGDDPVVMARFYKELKIHKPHMQHNDARQVIIISCLFICKN